MTGSGHMGALRGGAMPGKKEGRAFQEAHICATHAIKHSKTPHITCVRASPNTRTHMNAHTPLTPCLFPGLWLPPCLSFWLFLFQQSQLITPYCCRQLQTTTNLEFHYSKLFHMCIQGPGRLGWPRFRKEQPRIGTHPHPANTAILPSFFFFPSFSLFYVFTFSSIFLLQPTLDPTPSDPPTPLLHNHILIPSLILCAPSLHPSTAYTTCTMTLRSDSTVQPRRKNITGDITRFHTGPNERRGTDCKNKTASNA